MTTRTGLLSPPRPEADWRQPTVLERLGNFVKAALNACLDPSTGTQVWNGTVHTYKAPEQLNNN